MAADERNHVNEGIPVPTGVAIADARRQLFDAAERILLRAGPSALTSRAVTAEAGCAKGVLHRHFADFDTFLVELVLDRMALIEAQGAGLRQSAGTGTIAGNLATALTTIFSSVAVVIVGLLLSRHDLRTRLRETTPCGVPLATEAAAMIASYLRAERDLGRLAPAADVDTLAPTLIGAGHMLFADRLNGPPDAGTLLKVVSAVLGGAVP